MTYQKRQALLQKLQRNAGNGPGLEPVSEEHHNRRSNGHLCFAGDFEYYQQPDEQGEQQVFRAPRSNAFDLDGRRHGRWVSSLLHWGSRA